AATSSSSPRSEAASPGARRSCDGRARRPVPRRRRGGSMIAFLFPGQGSQAVGMGRAFHEASPAARAVFEQARAARGFDLTRVTLEGPGRDLALAAITQPAVLTASVAAAAACAERGLRPALAAGHSLGEYSALVVAGALPLGEAVRLVRRRGELMQEA